MSALSATEMILTPDGIVSHAVSDIDGTGVEIHPAAGTSADQFGFINGMLYAGEVTGDSNAIVLAQRALNALLSVVYRGQPVTGAVTTVDTFHPQYLFGARYAFTLSNGATVSPGTAYDIIPSQRIMPATEIDTSSEAYRYAREGLSRARTQVDATLWGAAYSRTMSQFNVSMSAINGLTYAPGAVPVKTVFKGTPLADDGSRWPVYVGKQAPTMWAAFGSWTQLSRTLTLIQDAQTAWQTQTGKNRGPVAPVFYFATPESTAYGSANTFGWNGPVNSDAAWQQFYMFREVSACAKNVSDATTKAQALTITEDVLTWLADEHNWLPSHPTIANAWSTAIRRAAILDYADAAEAHAASNLPMTLFGPPTNFPSDGVPLYTMVNPGDIGVIITALMDYDQLRRPNGNASGAMDDRVKRVLDRCIQALDSMYQTSGAMDGTFSPNPDGHQWYSMWHADLLEALCRMYQWTANGSVALPSLSKRAMAWLKGMIRWAVSASPTTSDDTWGAQIWPVAPDWASGIQESFEYSTQIITSEYGNEQRLARRVKARRSLSMRHTLTTADEAAAYQAVLRARQNRPMYVPQWHKAMRADEAAAKDTDQLVLSSEPPSDWAPGVKAYIVSGEFTQVNTISRIEGRAVTFKTPFAQALPKGTEAMAMYYGLVNPDLSSSRKTSTVLQAQTTFTMLPQSDGRVLPDRPGAETWVSFISAQGHRWANYIRRAAILSPAVWPTWPDPTLFQLPGETFTLNGDTRRVITRKPNWINEVSVSDTWSYDLVDYYNAAITPGGGEIAGKRTFQSLWSILSPDDEVDVLSMFKDLNGSRVACWVPSWSNDLYLANTMTLFNQITVENNAIIDEGILLGDPSIAIFVETRTGEFYTAAASSIQVGEKTSIITLDREFPRLLTPEQAMKICLMYRVRLASDMVEVDWKVPGIGELQMSFITVQE